MKSRIQIICENKLFEVKNFELRSSGDLTIHKEIADQVAKEIFEGFEESMQYFSSASNTKRLMEAVILIEKDKWIESDKK